MRLNRLMKCTVLIMRAGKLATQGFHFHFMFYRSILATWPGASAVQYSIELLYLLRPRPRRARTDLTRPERKDLGSGTPSCDALYTDCARITDI